MGHPHGSSAPRFELSLLAPTILGLLSPLCHGVLTGRTLLPMLALVARPLTETLSSVHKGEERGLP